MIDGNHSPSSHTTNIGFQRFVFTMGLPAKCLQNVGLAFWECFQSKGTFVLDDDVSSSSRTYWTGDSAPSSDKLNHTKSGLTHERKFHILAHRPTGKTPTFLND